MQNKSTIGAIVMFLYAVSATGQDVSHNASQVLKQGALINGAKVYVEVSSGDVTGLTGRGGAWWGSLSYTPAAIVAELVITADKKSESPRVS